MAPNGCSSHQPTVEKANAKPRRAGSLAAALLPGRQVRSLPITALLAKTVNQNRLAGGVSVCVLTCESSFLPEHSAVVSFRIHSLNRRLAFNAFQYALCSFLQTTPKALFGQRLENGLGFRVAPEVVQRLAQPLSPPPPSSLRHRPGTTLAGRTFRLARANQRPGIGAPGRATCGLLPGHLRPPQPISLPPPQWPHAQPRCAPVAPPRPAFHWDSLWPSRGRAYPPLGASPLPSARSRANAKTSRSLGFALTSRERVATRACGSSDSKANTSLSRDLSWGAAASRSLYCFNLASFAPEPARSFDNCRIAESRKAESGTGRPEIPGVAQPRRSYPLPTSVRRAATRQRLRSRDSCC